MHHDDDDEGEEEEELPTVRVFWRGPLNFLWDNKLALMTLIALITGMLVGCILGRPGGEWAHLTSRQVMSFEILGDLYSRGLRCAAILEICLTLLVGLAKLRPYTSFLVLSVALTFYFLISMVGAALGVLCALCLPLIDGAVLEPLPANFSDHEAFRFLTENRLLEDVFLDFLRNLIPPNVIQPFVYDAITEVKAPRDVNITELYILSITKSKDVHKVMSGWDVMVNQRHAQYNYTGLVAIAIVTGICLGVNSKRHTRIINMLWLFNKVIRKYIALFLFLSPIAVFFLEVSFWVKSENWVLPFEKAGWYSVMMLSGQFLMCVFVLPLIYVVILKREPFTYMFRCIQAFCNSIATASSLMTLPVSIVNVAQSGEVYPELGSLILSFGIRCNMSGTAFYLAGNSMYICLVEQSTMNSLKFVYLVIMSCFGSIIVAIQRTGLEYVKLMLIELDVPLGSFGYAVVVDKLADKYITLTNVVGDIMAVAVVFHILKVRLREDGETWEAMI